MRNFHLTVSSIGLIALFSVVFAMADDQPPPTEVTNQVVARIISRENDEMNAIRKYSPIVETYIQRVKSNGDDGWVPNGDRYFIGRAKLAEGLKLESLAAQRGPLQRVPVLNSLFDFGLEFLPKGFLQMAFLDTNGLNQENYKFDYVRREFLGEVRTLVFDVTPSKRAGYGRFVGRIWVEDQDFTIVRFNGSYSRTRNSGSRFEFDSWRVNAGPDLWLPAFIYSQERSGKNPSAETASVKAQTRLWAYDPSRNRQEEELSHILVESNSPVTDLSQSDNDLAPLQQKRAWDQQAANNVIEMLQHQGMIAPKGDVDKILDTVLNNLEVTNNLDFDPEVQCRILMTSTIESFSIGHTIILSRGMIDVLPDEASLAAMVAKELGHILLDHDVDTRLAFYDRVMGLEEPKNFQHLDLARQREENARASAKAAELLKNSPYRTQLRTAELFMAELQRRSRQVPSLIRPRLGDAVLTAPVVAPDTEDIPGDTEIVALPLGGRVKLDPWDNQLTLLDSKAVPNITQREKMPFEITPFVLYLTRQASEKQKTPRNNVPNTTGLNVVGPRAVAE